MRKTTRTITIYANTPTAAETFSANIGRLSDHVKAGDVMAVQKMYLEALTSTLACDDQ